ncbi:CoA ester lyase [Lentibacillus sp. N15]|uniref:HpcH/HpaI aldolase/citrate lyase family protein n=1 Tax=Lentibacillus songyuanensis TaxID=3136161 RepID=UPI0031BBA3BC
MLNRSLLFVPADKEKMLLKINQLAADIILIDLEDAIAIDDKPSGRDLIRKHIDQWKKPVFIRVNSIETNAFQEDMLLLKQLSHSGALQGVMLPKSSSEKDIKTLAKYLEAAGQVAKLRIIPLIESALGVKNAYEIAAADPRVTRLAFGGVDFTNDIGAEVTTDETELLYARSEIIVSSRCADIGQPIDTVYTDFKNSEGFSKNCAFARSLGFGGKLLIHPAQIEMANTAFVPTAEEMAFAKRLIAQAVKEKGAFQLDGKMIDKPIIDKAQRILDAYESSK